MNKFLLKTFALAALLPLCLPLPAQAQVAADPLAGATAANSTFFPNYKVAAFCQGNPYHRGVARCLDFQYMARALAVDDWQKISTEVQHECASNNPDGDYDLLYHCAEAHANDRKVQPNIAAQEHFGN